MRSASALSCSARSWSPSTPKATSTRSMWRCRSKTRSISPSCDSGSRASNASASTVAPLLRSSAAGPASSASVERPASTTVRSRRPTSWRSVARAMSEPPPSTSADCGLPRASSISRSSRRVGPPLEQRQHPLRLVLGPAVGRCEDEVRVLGSLVRAVHAREPGELAPPSLGVEPLGVPPLALLDGRVHEHLEEGQPDRLVGGPGLGPAGLEGADQPRHVAHPAHVLHAVLVREPEVAVQAVAEVVAVEQVGRASRLDELALEEH